MSLDIATGWLGVKCFGYLLQGVQMAGLSRMGTLRQYLIHDSRPDKSKKLRL